MVKTAIAQGLETFEKINSEGRTYRPNRFESLNKNLVKVPQEQQGCTHLRLAIICSVFVHVMKSTYKRTDLKTPISRLEIDHLAALANAHLGPAFLHVPRDTIRKIHNIHRLMPNMHPGYWRAVCSGSIALARVIRFLTSVGAQVYLPMPEEDVYGKIDLIAKFPEHSSWICFQIKGIKRSDVIEHEVLSLRDRGGMPRDRRFFLNGVRTFRSNHKGNFIPVELLVGGQAFPQYSTFAHDNAQEAFIQLRDSTMHL